jgi:hypothetical protein
MKCCPFVLVTVLVVSLGGTTQAAAQERNPRFELGVTRAWEGLNTGSRIGGQGGYFGFFFSSRLLLVNRVVLAFNDGGNRFNVGSELNYLFRGPKEAGPYASIGLDGTWGGQNGRAASLGAGYRLPVTHRLTLQAGLLHRRSLRDQVSQTGLSLGLGFNIGSRR